MPSTKRSRQARRLVLETLESRCVPTAGVFNEDFSADVNLSLAGFDTAADGTLILNDLPRYGAATEGPTGRGGYYSLQPGHTGDPGWGLHADGQVLLLLSSNLAVPQVTFTLPAAGTPGGPAANEVATGLGLSAQGFGRVVFFGTHGSLTFQLTGDTTWQRLAVDQNDLLPSGLEIGPISSVAAYSLEYLALDNVTVAVTSAEANQPPVANDDLVVLDRDFGESGLFHPLANDVDFNGDGVVLLSYTAPAYGTLTEFPQGFTYRAGAAFLNDPALDHDSFTYTIRDTQGATATATVNLYKALGRNDRYHVAHFATGTLTVPVAEGVLANDHAPPGVQLTARLVDRPLDGTVTFQPDGSFIYTSTRPDGLILDDSFTYELVIGGPFTETMVVTISPENARPEAFLRTVSDLHGRFIPDGARLVAGALPYQDGDGDPVTLTVVSHPSRGAVSFYEKDGHLWFAYVPAGNVLLGSDEFTFRVNDRYGNSNVGRVVINIPNAAPVAHDYLTGEKISTHVYRSLLAHDPVLGPSGSSTVSGNLLAFGSNDEVSLGHDDDGDPLTAFLDSSPDSQPRHGTIAISPDGTFTYTPAPGNQAWGIDRFGFRVSDGYDVSNVGYVTVRQSLGDLEARTDLFAISSGQTLRIPVSTLIGNDHFESGLVADLWVQAIRITEIENYVGNTAFEIHRVSDHSRVFRDEEVLLQDVLEIDMRSYSPPGVYGFTFKIIYPSPGLYPPAPPEETFWDSRVQLWYTETVQADTDGVPGWMEALAPFLLGDGNGDGIPDSQQSNVATLITHDAPFPQPDTWVTIAVPPGRSLFDVHARSLPAEPPPAGVELPLGMFGFQIFGLARGEGTTVTIYPHQPLSHPTYFKYGKEIDNPYGPEVDHWYEFLYDGATGAEFFDDNGDGLMDRIVLHLEDNERGDEDTRYNGVITDPGGPATRPRPQVERVVIGNDAAQRSRFFQVQVQFNDLVTLDRGAFALYLGNKRFAINSFFTSTVEGKTVATLQFPARLLKNLALPEGQYRLVTRGRAVHGLGGNMPADQTDTFFRLFGDVNGDGRVTAADHSAFATALGTRVGQAGYAWFFDYDGNGRIDAKDRAAFAARLRRFR